MIAFQTQELGELVSLLLLYASLPFKVTMHYYIIVSLATEKVPRSRNCSLCSFCFLNENTSL